MISVERSFFQRFPRLAEGRARSFSRPVVELLRKVACEDRINRTLAELSSLSGLDFIERALEKFNVSYRVAPTERENIPVEGRVIIVANHPLGAFDAIALLHLIGSVRRDVFILANDLLSQIVQLSSLLLPVNVFGGDSTTVGGLRAAYRALENEQALIVFPSGEVSRMGALGVRDKRWSSGFARLSLRTKSPVLPVHIAASNSPAFYGASMLVKPLSSLLLAREMFGAARTRIGISIGESVATAELQRAGASPESLAWSMRRHVYQLAKGNPTVFATARAIAHPEPALLVRRALQRAQILGSTHDGKRILLLDAQPDCAAMRELGRLRELSFRRVGEGSGTRRDLDRFDAHYQHLILWDEHALAIVGAYRLGDAATILHQQGMQGLYSATLFDYAPAASDFLSQGVELGRSFVQPAYWNSRSLDCLWQGIGAYLRHRPEIRYLFGPVSLSAALPPGAQEWIAHCHRHYFGDVQELARARRPLLIPADIAALASATWAGRDLKSGLSLLKQQLAKFSCSMPMLYRHYADICEQDGVRFLAFGTDPAFGHCVDGLIRLDLSQIKAHKRARYLQAA